MAAATQSPVRYSNDLSPFEDGLERKAYIDAVRDLVLNVTPPFTVGILGDWGTGKTTFMEQVRKGLPEGECRTVWFNLWEHERDADPIIAMLHEARRQLGKYLEDETSAAAEAQALAKAVAVPADPSTPSARLTRTQKIQLILTAVVLGTPAVVATAYAAASGILPWLVPLLLKVGSVGQKWVRDHAPQVWNLLKDATDLGKKGTDIWKNFRDAGKNDETHVDALKGQVTATAFETADREVSLKAQFQEVLALLTGAPEEDAEQANPEETAETGNKHRVVFFIDDLDRCSPEAAVTLLERIKLFLYNDYCVFVIGLDDIATQKAVARVHQFDAYDPARAKTSASVQRVQDSADQASSDRSSDKELDAQHYLEKIIQFPDRIPPVVEKKHREYIAEILKANGLGDLESEGQDKDGSVISIFDAALSETNAPLRQVKRLVNLFTFNHVIAKTQFTAKDIGGKEVGYNPAIMAGVTALQVLHEETYRKICSGRNRQHRGRILAKLFGAFEPDATVSQDWVSEAPTPELKALWDEQPSTADLVWNPAQDSALEQLRLQVHAIPGRPRTDVSGHDLPVCQYYEQYIQWAAASAPAAPEMKALPKPTYERFEVSRTELDKYPPLDETGKEADPGEWIKENWLGQEWWSDAPLRLSAGGFVWRVMKLDNSDNPTRALLLSEYVIARGPYHGSFESVTWETSDIRQWLNGEFLNRLPEDFRRRVSPGDMVFPENPFYPTHDYVFLLSTQEAADCLISDTTETVIQKAAEMREGLVARLPPRAPYDGLGETRSWYLGPVGAPRVGAPVVNRDGFVHPYDRGVRDARGGVRPALWMNL